MIDTQSLPVGGEAIAAALAPLRDVPVGDDNAVTEALPLAYVMLNPAQTLPETFRKLFRRDLSTAELAAMQPGARTDPPPGDNPLLDPFLCASPYLRSLADSLASWVDTGRLLPQGTSPLSLLQAVCDHAGATVPADFLSTLAPDRLEDDAWLDEAAILFRYIGRGMVQRSESFSSDLTRQLDALREPYLAALREALDEQKLRSGLLRPPEGGVASEAVYFDGFALRNARGKTFSEISALPGIADHPALLGLTPSRKEARLRERFTELGEDTHYPVGSVSHSLASAVMRIRAYQHAAPLPADQGEPAWAQAFSEIETQWAQNRDYPLHPRILFALHLKSSSQALLVGDDWRERLWNDIVEPNVRNKIQPCPPNAISMAQSAFEQLRGEARQTGADEASSNRQAVVGLFDQIVQGRLIRVPGSPLHAASATSLGAWKKQRKLQKELDALVTPLQEVLSQQLNYERIEGTGAAGKLRALLTYADERLRAAYHVAPTPFSREAAAADILRHHGVTESALHSPRFFSLAGENQHIQTSRFGTPVDEFLARADWGGLSGKAMRIAGQSIQPRTLLQQAETQYNDNLKTDSWVLARAKENLRLSGRVPLPGRVSAEAQRIAAHFATETETHRGWMNGLETWVNTIPLIGPIYNIEEGIRQHHPWQGILGALFLGLDAIDLLSGGGSAREEGLGGAESVETWSLRTSTSGSHLSAETEPLLGTRARQIAGNQIQLRVDFADDLPSDVFGTAQREADPVGVKRKNATPAAWRRPGAINLPRDESVRGSPVAERLTCEQVKALIDQAGDTGIKAFDELFSRHFQVERHGENSGVFDPQTYFKSLYQHSPTFRRLMNQYVAAAPDGEPWHIHIGKQPAARQPPNFTHFDSKTIHLQSDSELSALRYMSSRGWAPMRVEQAHLHEMLHALTGARDPEPMLELLNRGPVVYLTDRILAESGQVFPQRVMYRREDGNGAQPRHDTAEGNRLSASAATEVENRFLDQYLAQRNPSSASPSAWALDAIGDLVTRVKISATSMNGSFRAEQRIVTPPTAQTGPVSLPHFLLRLTERSPLFRTLLERSDAALPKWTLEWGDQPVSRIDREQRRIVFGMPDNRFYLHGQGVAPLEAQRQIGEALVEALGGIDRERDERAHHRRGGVVVLAQKILEESGFHYPRRLSAAEADADREQQMALLSWLTPARRLAEAEDGALVSALARDEHRGDA
jgi:hypothetical protein